MADNTIAVGLLTTGSALAGVIISGGMQLFLSNRNYKQQMERDRNIREQSILSELAMRAYELIAERKSIAVILLREVVVRAELQQGVRMLQLVGISFFTRYLSARIAAGELRPHDPEVTARMLIGSVLALHLSDAPAETYLPGVVETLLSGIEAR